MSREIRYAGDGGFLLIVDDKPVLDFSSSGLWTSDELVPLTDYEMLRLAQHLLRSITEMNHDSDIAVVCTRCGEYMGNAKAKRRLLHGPGHCPDRRTR